MRSLLPITAVVALAIGGMTSGYAQERSTTTPPAVSSPKDTAKTTAAPVAGKNSFTKKQARSRLKKHGYTQVTGLTKDANSVWHAKATKAGNPVGVSLDYQGNITEE